MTRFGPFKGSTFEEVEGEELSPTSLRLPLSSFGLFPGYGVVGFFVSPYLRRGIVGSLIVLGFEF